MHKSRSCLLWSICRHFFDFQDLFHPFGHIDKRSFPISKMRPISHPPLTHTAQILFQIVQYKIFTLLCSYCLPQIYKHTIRIHILCIPTIRRLTVCHRVNHQLFFYTTIFHNLANRRHLTFSRDQIVNKTWVNKQ